MDVRTIRPHTHPTPPFLCGGHIAGSWMSKYATIWEVSYLILKNTYCNWQGTYETTYSTRQGVSGRLSAGSAPLL
ncbi:hypothetical protein KSD_33920 [Ktedonobacter sp. SOSP1-85]|nr:hypothetical protein KSD_33920 [Ktedonobacter sp. SOSP1-85]